MKIFGAKSTKAGADKAPSPRNAPRHVVLRVRGGALRFGERSLWHDLDFDVRAGEFIAVLGANGSGKSSLLKVILGQQQLSAGTMSFEGAPVTRGNRRIGYIPQQKLADEGAPLRGRDLVALGVDGHRFGLPLPRAARRREVDALLDSVGASEFANVAVSTLSGGEQQRLRVG